MMEESEINVRSQITNYERKDRLFTRTLKIQQMGFHISIIDEKNWG